MPNPIPREQVEKSQTWNSESVFSTPEAFDTEVTSLLEKLRSTGASPGARLDLPRARWHHAHSSTWEDSR